ncbi:MAG: hypothetical protein ACTS45_01690 [Candidatus Hodgkinia cicadicola]
MLRHSSKLELFSKANVKQTAKENFIENCSKVQTSNEEAKSIGVKLLYVLKSSNCQKSIMS